MSIYRVGGGVVGATLKFTDHLTPATRGKVPTHQGGLPAHRGETIKDPLPSAWGLPPPNPPVGALRRTPASARTPDQTTNGHNKTPSAF